MKHRYQQLKQMWQIFHYLFSHNRMVGSGSGILTLVLFTFLGTQDGASLGNVGQASTTLKLISLLLGQTVIGTSLVATPFIWWIYGRKAFGKRLLEFVLSSLMGSSAFVAIFTILIAAQLDTIYTDGYTHFGFWAIHEGMSEQEVNGVLDLPFIIREVEPYIDWVYASETQPQFAITGEIIGSYTFFRFDQRGYVTHMGGALIENGSSYFGADHNYLAISTVEANQLVGLSREAIQERYGKPTGIYQFKVVKLYEYSYSPYDTHYSMRQIGFDWTGKVVYKNGRIYWD